MKSNAILFTPDSVRLGQIHWYLLRAAKEMQEQCYQVPERTAGLFSRADLTALGREVARDEIHWWVFKRERAIDQLQTRTEQILSAVQKLKRASHRLSARIPSSYDELLCTFSKFAESYAGEIVALQDYVTWLNDRDVLAPCILYTYRVWGTTRRMERWVQIAAHAIEEEPTETIHRLTEAVFGLWRGHKTTLEAVRADMEYELFEAAWDAGRPDKPVIAQDVLISRAGHEILDEFAAYFECLRNSLQNILLDIEKYAAQRDLLKSDLFWTRFVEWAVSSGKTEQQLWDFKKTLKMWNIRGEGKEEAEAEFAEDIASFANANGGVLVVGVSDARDVEGIGGDAVEVERRLHYTRLVIAEYVQYNADIVHLRTISIADACGVRKTCLVIAIAQSCAAVAVRDRKRKFSFPVRRETGLARVDPEDLAPEKLHIGNDNYDFVRDLDLLVRSK